MQEPHRDVRGNSFSNIILYVATSRLECRDMKACFPGASPCRDVKLEFLFFFVSALFASSCSQKPHLIIKPRIKSFNALRNKIGVKTLIVMIKYN